MAPLPHPFLGVFLASLSQSRGFIQLERTSGIKKKVISTFAQHHKILFHNADVTDLDTALSVERPETLEEETYLCPSETAYIRPLRVLNDCGWKIIVNNIKVNYQDFTQTTRVEECTTSGEACPIVPHCYETKCLQKSAYHRFLVYNPYDKYFPFEIHTFKLPSSCACFINEFQL
ncbi:neurotrophin 1-like [Oratosquilla oratoria]|uniref:neurotrophin 1-like n=1 Tax=Oratosquilla oratoria TaxID=337810 RepID=UPI003F773B76